MVLLWELRMSLGFDPEWLNIVRKGTCNSLVTIVNNTGLHISKLLRESILEVLITINNF